MTLTPVPVGFSDIGHRVRELVCTYRPARDHSGSSRLPTLRSSTSRGRGRTSWGHSSRITRRTVRVRLPLGAHELLAWHLLARGTRTSAQVSVPDVFVPRS